MTATATLTAPAIQRPRLEDLFLEPEHWNPRAQARIPAAWKAIVTYWDSLAACWLNSPATAYGETRMEALRGLAAEWPGLRVPQYVGGSDERHGNFNIRTHNGMVTLEKKSNNERRTLRIHTPQRGKLQGRRIVSLLRGPNRDNRDHWTPFAFADSNGVRVWRKYHNTEYDRFAAILNRPGWFADLLNVMIEGRCRRCNRPLTVPDSIRAGIGPVCGGRE